MITRSTFITAAILAGVAATTAPAKADPTRTFDAWGHRFTVPGTQATVTAAPANEATTASLAPRRSYASAKAGNDNTGSASEPAIRTLDVWGARVDAPRY